MAVIEGLTGLTGLTGLSGLTEDLPIRIVMTDDPMRTKMMAAHWLNNAKTLYESRGMIGYIGAYNSVDIALLSVGYGESPTMLYLHDAALLGAQRAIYIGECVARRAEDRLRDVIIAKGGDAAMTQNALTTAKQFAISVKVRNVITNDRALLDGSSTSEDIADFASGAVSRLAANHGLAALSILTVSRNTATKERMEEHERQSRFNEATQLVFETLSNS
ncbi:MAG: hypothetical protein FWH57_11320 [Oscillospiraceae bacterium]|nr:hypothetical protein [Oscillospiraceae bacterium]